MLYKLTTIAAAALGLLLTIGSSVLAAITQVKVCVASSRHEAS